MCSNYLKDKQRINFQTEYNLNNFTKNYGGKANKLTKNIHMHQLAYVVNVKII